MYDAVKGGGARCGEWSEAWLLLLVLSVSFCLKPPAGTEPSPAGGPGEGWPHGGGGGLPPGQRRGGGGHRYHPSQPRGRGQDQVSI